MFWKVWEKPMRSCKSKQDSVLQTMDGHSRYCDKFITQHFLPWFLWWLFCASWFKRTVEEGLISFNIIGNPTDKRVWFFLNHWNQQVGRCVLLNHHEWRECNDRNEWWFSRTHRPTSWLKWFRKNLTSLRWDFLLIQGLKPWIIQSDSAWFQCDSGWYQCDSVWFRVIQGDSGWFRVIQDDSVWFHRREIWNHTAVWFHRRGIWNHTAVWFHRR